MARLAEMSIDLFTIPLPEPIEAHAAGLMRDFDLVTARVQDTDGATGMGYTVLHQGQGGAVAAIADLPLREYIMGEESDRIEWLWRQMYRRHHYAGRGAPLTFAMAAIDVALWDMKATKAQTPLWRYLGGHDQKVRAYAGNIDLNFPVDRLVAEALDSVNEGFRAVKMRLGRPTLAEDIARVAAVREALPDDVELMADANEAWRVDQAAQAMRALQPFNLVWLEEPIAPDNFEGYRHLRALGGVPLAAGENLHTVAEFTQLISVGGVDFPEPDLTTCGGVTPFMKVATLAEAHGLPVTSHGAHDLHVHLLAACPNAAYLEWHRFGLHGFMEAPIKVVDGYAEAPDRPGHGVRFDWAKLEAFAQT